MVLLLCESYILHKCLIQVIVFLSLTLKNVTYVHIYVFLDNCVTCVWFSNTPFTKVYIMHFGRVSWMRKVSKPRIS